MSVIFLFHLIVKSEHVAPFLFHFLFRNTCGSSASTKLSVSPFAEAPQAPNFLFCHLRKLRKRQIPCFAICGSSASATFFVLPFAEAPQAPNFLFRHLRKLRKHQIFCFTICGSSASAKFLVLPFAEAPQALKLLFSPLLNGDRCWNGRGGACVPARTSAQRRFHTKNRFVYHALCAGMNDGCALAGRHGRAHRHRPYPSPSCLFAPFH